MVENVLRTIVSKPRLLVKKLRLESHPSRIRHVRDTAPVEGGLVEVAGSAERLGVVQVEGLPAVRQWDDVVYLEPAAALPQ